jgi:RHS repeat-associated protein
VQVGASAVSAERQYDAFGNVLGSTGTWKSPFGYAGSFGYQEDESGYKLLGHRTYDPDTGRFLTRDPAKDGRNWYAYCGNNPVGRFDANGQSWQDCIDFFAGVGDTITFGGTKVARRWLGEQLGYGDANESVNQNSGWYEAGRAGGFVLGLAINWEGKVLSALCDGARVVRSVAAARIAKPVEAAVDSGVPLWRRNEEYLARVLNGRSQVSMQAWETRRVVDVLTDTSINEAKTGRVCAEAKIIKQVNKDSFIMHQRNLSGEWHFFPNEIGEIGPSGPLSRLLEERGIKTRFWN